MLEAGLKVVRFYRGRAPLVAEARGLTYPKELDRLMVIGLDDLAASVRND